MPKIYDLRRNTAVPNGAGLTFDPLLMLPNSVGVDQPVAPHICIPIPKAAAASAGVTTPMAVGNVTVVHNAGAPVVFDILTMRLHTIQGVTGVASENYSTVLPAQSVAAGAGTAVNPLLTQGGVAQIPDICIPIPRTAPANATDQSFVPTVLATGNITFRTAEVGAIVHTILMLRWHAIQRVVSALFGPGQDRRRYFTIGNAINASAGAIYSDDDDPTRLFVVEITKVSGDGSLLLTTAQIAGTTAPTTGGADSLTLVSGTGSAAIPYTGVRFEKYMDLRQNTAVANGAGLTFDPGLVENGVPVMPDIVIPIPKATGCVPFVATDLAGAVGTVTVAHNNVGPVACDILSIRAHSIFRDT